MKLYRNPFVFFILEGSDLVVWDYLNHNQYKLSGPYFERLQYWGPSTVKSALDSLDHDLLEGGLLQKEPFKIPPWKWDILSKIFHVGTQDIPVHKSPSSKEEWIAEYASECALLPAKRDDPLETQEWLPLPEANLALLASDPYLNVLLSRKTNRVFFEKPLSTEVVSTLLFSSFGKIHGEGQEYSKDNTFVTEGFHKASPSGGGLHPIDAYVFAFNVEGLQKGVYRYCSKRHALSCVRKGLSYEEIIPSFYNQFYLENISVGVFLVADFDRCWDKYPHSRAYRVALMDAGHLSQTFLLNATALKLNTWLSAAFKDKEISKVLQIDGIVKSPLHFVAAGQGANSALPLSG